VRLKIVGLWSGEEVGDRSARSGSDWDDPRIYLPRPWILIASLFQNIFYNPELYPNPNWINLQEENTVPIIA
jgi:hypothetical protein